MSKVASIFRLLLAAAVWLSGVELSAFASGQFTPIKITTQAEGLHHLTAAALAPLMASTPEAVRSRILAGSLTLLNRGQPIGWLPGADGSDLLFHAEPLRNNYTS